MSPVSGTVSGKPVEARFDGGLLLFGEVERRLGVAARLAACLRDPRDPRRVAHGLDEMIRFRALTILAGYADGNDVNSLRHDPLFKMALDRLPDTQGDLCSQPTISRLETLASRADLYRMGAALIDLYCTSYGQVPSINSIRLGDLGP